MNTAEWAAIRARTAEILYRETWLEVERNAREVRLLGLEYKLGICAFRSKGTAK
jgi:hypothetical protein